MSETLKPVLATLARAERPAAADVQAAIATILAGEAGAAQIGALLMGLERIGVSASEVAAAARAMRAIMTRVEVPFETVDVCGTGGDGSHTLNISTAVSFVLAGCGLKVAKHGNRALSSTTGAADVLEALGVVLVPDPAVLRAALEQAGVAFLFAPNHHPAMRHVGPARKELGFRTLFNLLGPLCNPAGASRQLVGVFAPERVRPQAEALAELGCRSAWTVCGEGGLDEVALHGRTHVCSLRDGRLTDDLITPEDIGLARRPLDTLRGGDARFNATALQALLNGASGAYRDAVILNTACALVAAGAEQDLVTAAARAARALETGAAARALTRLVAVTAGVTDAGAEKP
jgi:anthranilate phosphoribosyltransferase